MRRPVGTALCLSLILGPILTASVADPASAAPGDADRARAAFVEAYTAATEGDLATVAGELDTLEGHVLYPYVQAAYFHWGLAQTDWSAAPGEPVPVSLAQVVIFLRAHPELALDELREELLLAAVEAAVHRPEAHELILDLGSADAEHPTIYCAHLAARLQLARQSDAGPGRALTEDALVEDALAAWEVGRDRPATCDPVFAWLEAQGHLTAERYRSRIARAEEAERFGLASFLAEQAGDRLEPWELQRVTLLELASRDPEAALAAVGGVVPTPTDADPGVAVETTAPTANTPPVGAASAANEVATLALRRLARMDPATTADRFEQLAERFALTEAQRAEAWREIALWGARTHHPEARRWLLTAEDPGDTWVLQWRVRAALRDQDWPAVLAALDGLPASAQAEPVWIYWRGRALAAVGQPEEAAAQYRRIAGRSDYYGFLAADRLGSHYALDVAAGERRPRLAEELNRHPGLRRAGELFHAAALGAPVWHLARTEWDRALEDLVRTGPDGARAQAAMIAADWGWHSQALVAAWSAGLGEDYELRYPRPWHDLVHGLAEQHGLDESWVYGIIRSESLFMPDAHSSAGAHGLMQLMPPTARDLLTDAPEYWEGAGMLHRPELNLRLGTDYLGRMAARFQSHPMLASAAYNAGPHRVEAWLPEEGVLPADIWAETVPFLETRQYIRRVFTAATIFRSRMAEDGHGRQTLRLSARFAGVHPDGETAVAEEEADRSAPSPVKTGL